MAPAARLRLFGVPVLVDGGGTLVKLRSAKQLGALVYLALEGREQPVSRDRLVDLLWPEVPPERGRHSLAQACSAIRAALGSGALGRMNGAVRLDASLETDLDAIPHEFDRLSLTDPLREAEWWAGPEFAHWVDGARGRLRRAAEEALRRAVADFRRQGQSARVHAAAEVLYRLDPLSDTAVHALAERELITGDVVGAIRLLRTHLARVQEVLGCTPNRDLERLLRRLEAGSHPPVEQVPSGLAPEAQNLKPSVFLGREKELALLEAEWQRVGESGFRSCLVLGPAGIGKSSLVRRFAATIAARAQPVFLVTCQEIGEEIPFAALSDLITSLSRDPSVSGTDPRWLAEIARIHPALRAQYPGVPEAHEAPPESIRMRVAEGMLHALDAVSDGAKIGIIFDDLPFMDSATRDVLHGLARRAADRHVLLIATARTSELLGPSRPMGRGTAIVPWLTTIHLQSLSTACTRQLAHALSPRLGNESTVVDRIERIADGNPQFTELLVADWEEYAAASLAGGQRAEGLPDDWRPPESFREAFAHTYDDLSDRSQQILQVLAVAGRSLPIGELEASTARRPGVNDDEVLTLLRRGILRLDGGALAFKNELHRAYVYYATTGDVRRFIHSRLGRSLLSRNDADYRSRFEAVSHLQTAGLHDEATMAVISAAQLAISNGAPAEAESVLRKVLRHPSPADTRSLVALLLAEALAARGKYVEANDVLVSIDSASLPATHARARAAYIRALVLQRARVGSDRATEAAVREAVRLAKGVADENLLASATLIAAEASFDLALADVRAEALSTVQHLASTATGAGARGLALLTTAYCLITEGRFDEAHQVFQESASQLLEAGLDFERIRALNGQVSSLLGAGRYREVPGVVQAGLKLTTSIGDVDHRAIFIGNLGLGYEEIGQFEDALVCYLQAARSEGLVGHRRRVVSECNLAHLYILLGDNANAASHLELAREAADLSGLWRLQALADYVNADLLLASGEEEYAWPLVERAARATRGREAAIDTNGQAIRLQLQLATANHGARGLVECLSAMAENPPRLRTADRQEVSLCLRWLMSLHGIRSHPQPQWLSTAEPLNLGPLANLLAVGLYDDKHTPVPGETAAAALHRLYPIVMRECTLPPAKEVLLSWEDY